MYLPTIQEIETARRVFRQREPRDLFYRVATELIELSIRRQTTLTVPEALAVLLQTWNKNFYRFHGGFSEQHLAEIEDIVSSCWPQISLFRQRSIESLNANDERSVLLLFTRFERVLAAVGASKCLHLLAPKFFPLWDRNIIKAYDISLNTGPCNAEVYLRFMRIAQQQCNELRRSGVGCQDLLKALDEYNYCAYTLKPQKA